MSKPAIQLLTILLLGFFVSSCQKNENPPKIDAAIVGKWKLSQTRVGTGGPGEWITVTAPKYLQLNADGTISTDYFEKEVVNYSVAAEQQMNLLVFTQKDGTVFRHLYLAGDNILDVNMSRFPAMCTEGCTARFVREQ